MTGDSIVYKNHDLMLGVDQSGKISLLGRAARAEGYYSVTFDRMETLKDFISQKKNNFSEKQAFWLQWVIENRIEKRKNNAHG
jgi:predicted RNA-binding protein with RPS1 domain